MGIRSKQYRVTVHRKQRPMTNSVVAFRNTDSTLWHLDFFTGIGDYTISRQVMYENGTAFSSGTALFCASKENKKVVVFGTNNAVYSTDTGKTWKNCVINNFANQSISLLGARMIYHPGVGYFLSNGVASPNTRLLFSGDGITWTRIANNMGGYVSPVMLANNTLALVLTGSTTIAYTDATLIRAAWDADPTVLFNPTWQTTVTTGAAMSILLTNADGTLIKGIRAATTSPGAWEGTDVTQPLTALSGTNSLNPSSFRYSTWSTLSNAHLFGAASYAVVAYARPGGRVTSGDNISTSAQVFGESVFLNRLFVLTSTSQIRFTTVRSNSSGAPNNSLGTSNIAVAGLYYDANGDFYLES